MRVLIKATSEPPLLTHRAAQTRRSECLLGVQTTGVQLREAPHTVACLPFVTLGRSRLRNRLYMARLADLTGTGGRDPVVAVTCAWACRSKTRVCADPGAGKSR